MNLVRQFSQLVSGKTFAAISEENGTAITLGLTPKRDKIRLDFLRQITTQDAAAGGNKRVVEIVTGRSVFLKTVELPQMPKKEALATLRYIENGSVPFDLAEACVDVWIVENNGAGRKIKVLMAAAGKDEFVRRREAAKKSSLKLSGVSIGPAAIGALIRHSLVLDTSKATLFIYLNENITGVCVFKNALPIFTREIFFGTGGQCDPSNGGGARLDRVAKEISRSLDYFRETYKTSDIKNGYIIGAGSSINDIENILGEHTGIALNVYDPYDDFLFAGSGADVKADISGPRIALAVGAALDNGKSVNLSENNGTPPYIKRPLALAAMSAAFVIMILSAAVWHKVFSGLDVKTEHLRKEIGLLEHEKSANEKLKEKLLAITARTRIMEQKIGAYPPGKNIEYDWPNIFRAVGEAMPANASLTRLVIDFTRQNKTREHSHQNVSFEGIVRGSNKVRLAALNKLLGDLSGSSFFKEVSIAGAARSSIQSSDNNQMTFRIKARLGMEPFQNAMRRLPDGKKGS